MTEEQSTLTGIEKKYRYSQADGDYPKIIKGDINYCFAFPFDAQRLCEELNEMVETIETLKEENEHLKTALKNSYINEICENCKYGHYWISEYEYGLEGDFECTKKHFGKDDWKCDGLTECDDFELELKGDV